MTAESATAHDGELLQVAAEHATARVPVAAPHERAGDVRSALAGLVVDCADDIAVLVEGRLVGILPIERLLAAPADAQVQDVMDPDPPTIAPGADQELAAWKMVRRGESSLAVVDEDGRFVGLIPPHRMLSVLLAEHDEDLARLGGYLAGSAGARLAAEEPLGRRLVHRLPWLLVGLVGAMASAVLIGAFEEELSDQVLLSFFIPGAIYLAAAVGSQTQMVLVRGFSVGVGIRGIAGRELLTGLIIGLVIAVAFVPFAQIGWGDTDVAIAVGLALLASSAVATVIAMVLPVVFRAFGQDPAFGSGPLATLLQDLATIVVYFAIAIPLAT